MTFAPSAPLIAACLIGCVALSLFVFANANANANAHVIPCTALLTKYLDRQPTRNQGDLVSRASLVKDLDRQFEASIMIFMGKYMGISMSARNGQGWDEAVGRDFRSIAEVVNCYASDARSVDALHASNPSLEAGFERLFSADKRTEMLRAVDAKDYGSWAFYGPTKECGEAAKNNYMPDDLKSRCLMSASEQEDN